MCNHVWIVFLLIFAFGCAESENPTAPVEYNENEYVGAHAPEGELPTIVMRVTGVRRAIPGVLEKRFVIIDDRLTEVDVAIQEPIYYLLMGDSFENFVPLNPDTPSLTKFNVLDNHIIDNPDNAPIRVNDKIEVVVRRRFKYKRVNDGRRNNFIEMVFVDVVRNLTRPDVKF